MGMPLPKGTIRVFKEDSEGDAQFIGEDRIDQYVPLFEIRDELEQRTKIMRERNMIRREAAQVAALTAVLVIGANLFAPPSLPVEGDSAAQVLPLFLAVAFVFVFSRVRKLAEPEIQPRFLSSSAEVLEAATYRPKTLPGARTGLEEGTR